MFIGRSNFFGQSVKKVFSHFLIYISKKYIKEKKNGKPIRTVKTI